MWEIVHTIPGPGRAEADFGAFRIETDHPGDGAREGRAPEPWCLFLASIGTCMAAFVEEHCVRHGLSTEGIRIVQGQTMAEDDDVLREIRVTIETPEGFPSEHRDALVEAAGRCTVKRVIEAAPEFRIEATSNQGRAPN